MPPCHVSLFSNKVYFYIKYQVTCDLLIPNQLFIFMACNFIGYLVIFHFFLTFILPQCIAIIVLQLLSFSCINWHLDTEFFYFCGFCHLALIFANILKHFTNTLESHQRNAGSLLYTLATEYQRLQLVLIPLSYLVGPNQSINLPITPEPPTPWW